MKNNNHLLLYNIIPDFNVIEYYIITKFVKI